MKGFTCNASQKSSNLSSSPLSVRALDDARACGGPFSAEELLQGVASRVEARQAQEIVIQQLQAKTKVGGCGLGDAPPPPRGVRWVW